MDRIKKISYPVVAVRDTGFSMSTVRVDRIKRASRHRSVFVSSWQPCRDVVSALALERKRKTETKGGRGRERERLSKLEEYSVFKRTVTKLANRLEYDYTRKETSWSGIEE